AVLAVDVDADAHLEGPRRIAERADVAPDAVEGAAAVGAAAPEGVDLLRAVEGDLPGRDAEREEPVEGRPVGVPGGRGGGGVELQARMALAEAGDALEQREDEVALEERLAAEPGEREVLERRRAGLEQALEAAHDGRGHPTDDEVLVAVEAAEVAGFRRHHDEV